MPRRRRSSEKTDGSTLHAYDVDLCRYVLDNIVSHFDDPNFVAFARASLQAECADILVKYHEADDGQDMLLSLDELDHFSAMLSSGDDLQFDRPWLSDPGRHRRHRNCLAEIRELLSRNEATEWGRLSTRFGRQLESPHLLLVEGIEIVRDWICELRQLMRLTRVTEVLAWLPVPEGNVPTMVPLGDVEVGAAEQGDAKAVPFWDRDRFTLSIDGVTIRRVRPTAKNVIPILDVFQEFGWPPRIDDPIPPTPVGVQKDRLDDAIKSLNRGLKMIRFGGDGTGEGIKWERV